MILTFTQKFVEWNDNSAGGKAKLQLVGYRL